MEDSVRSGNPERGWNDPPEFLHEGSSHCASSAPNKLNKRVSHNLDGSLIKPDNVSALTEPPKYYVVNSKVGEALIESEAEPKAVTTEMSNNDIEQIFVAKVAFCKENSLSVS